MYKLLLILALLAVPAPQTPYPPPLDVYPQPYPGHNTTPSGPGLTPEDPRWVYRDAIAIYEFNDPANLGKDSLGRYDLTPVNTPTATGGATGYAADLDGTDQYAASTTFAPGTMSGFFISAWFSVDAIPAGTEYLMSNYSAANGGFLLDMRAAGTSVFVVADGSDRDTHSEATVLPSQGTGRRHIEAWLSGGAAHISADGGATVNDSADVTVESIYLDATDPLYVGRYGSKYLDGVAGSIAMYDAVPSDAVKLSLYNSGKGKTCEAMTDAEKVNLVSCWDMDEDGGPYEDDVQLQNSITRIDTASSFTFGNAKTIDFLPPTSISLKGKLDNLLAYSFLCLDDGGMVVNPSVDADYCFYVYQTEGWAYAWENGNNAGGALATTSPGDDFEIRMTDGVVTYYINGALEYTSLIPATGTYQGLAQVRDQWGQWYDISFNGDPRWDPATIDTNYIARGANPLLGVNTPTQAAALVEQPLSGMGVNLVKASEQELTNIATYHDARALSVCSWSNSTATGVAGYIVGNYLGSGPEGWLLGHSSSDRPVFYTYPADESATGNSNVAVNVVDGKWHSICGTFDYPNGTVWVDGVPDGTPSTIADVLDVSNLTFSVGSPAAAPSDYDGLTDQVVVWPYNIGSAGVAAFHAAGEGIYYTTPGGLR